MEAYRKLVHGCNDYCWLFDGLARTERIIHGIDPCLGCAFRTPSMVRFE